MAVDTEFPDVRRRLRQLEQEIGEMERMLEPSGGAAAAGSTTIYILGQHTREFEQTTHLLRYYERQHNGYHLDRNQKLFFVASLAVSATLLVMYVLQVIL